MLRSAQSGFITIEVLVAIMLAASALASVLMGMTSSLFGSSAAAHTADALSIAKSQLALVRVSALRVGVEEGRHDARYGWSRSVSETPRRGWSQTSEDAGSELRLLRIDVAVNWTNAGRRRELTLHSLHAAPRERAEAGEGEEER
jgi:hypothetical protein